MIYRPSIHPGLQVGVQCRLIQPFAGRKRTALHYGRTGNKPKWIYIPEAAVLTHETEILPGSEDFVKVMLDFIADRSLIGGIPGKAGVTLQRIGRPSVWRCNVKCPRLTAVVQDISKNRNGCPV